MRAPRRHGKSRANRLFKVDGREYTVSVSDGVLDNKANVRLHISLRAQFGTQSVCQVRGLTNRSLWHDYPRDIEKWRAEAISVTPRVVCELIRLAHQKGWDPEGSRSNFELFVDREMVRSELAGVETFKLPLKS